MPGEACNCQNMCGGEPGCAVIFIHEVLEDGSEGPGECIADCGSDEATAATKRGLPLDTLVNLETSGKVLGSLGEFLGEMTGSHVAVPTTTLRKEVTLSLRSVSLRTALETAGLVVLEPTPDQVGPEAEK